MTVRDLYTLFDYSYWANERLFRVIEGLPGEAFTRAMPGGHPSVRNTMVHILSAEWGWLGRCGGPERPGRLDPDDFPTVEVLREAWERVDAAMREFLAGLSDAALSQDVVYPGAGGALRRLPLGELLHHAANHAVHHRGQVALLIRQLGYAPGAFDILFYYAEKRGVTAW